MVNLINNFKNILDNFKISLKEEYIILFFVAGSLLGWIENFKDKHYSQKISPISIILIESIIFLICVIPFAFIFNKNYDLLSDVKKLNFIDYIPLFILSIIGVFSSLFYIYIVKEFDIEKIQMTSYITDALIIVLGYLLFSWKSLNYYKIIGLIFLIIAAYLLK